MGKGKAGISFGKYPIHLPCMCVCTLGVYIEILSADTAPKVITKGFSV